MQCRKERRRGCKGMNDISKRKRERPPPKTKTMEEFCAASRSRDPPCRSSSTIRTAFGPLRASGSSRPFAACAIGRRSLRGQFQPWNPKILGMIVSSLTDPFFAGLIESAEQRAMQDGYWTIILSDGQRAMEVRAIQTIMSLRVAGAIVAPLGIPRISRC